MRQNCLLRVTMLFWLLGAQQVTANCVTIDRLYQLQTLQMRLAQDTQGALFANDIRQIRAISQDISNSAAQEAVGGNMLAGKGARIVRFLQNTQRLVQRASLDDPLSVQPHFTRQVTQNMRAVQRDLHALRCTKAEIETEIISNGDAPNFSTSTDAEDLAQVANVVRAVSEEVFRPRSLIIMLISGVLLAVALPALRKWRLLRMRQAKRHNTLFETDYRLAGDTTSTRGVLVDISCHGAKLQHNRTTSDTVGTEFEVRIEDAWIAGTVMWSNAFYSGVKFSKLISLAQVSFACEATKTNFVLGKKRKTAPRKAPS